MMLGMRVDYTFAPQLVQNLWLAVSVYSMIWYNMISLPSFGKLGHGIARGETSSVDLQPDDWHHLAIHRHLPGAEMERSDPCRALGSLPVDAR